MLPSYSALTHTNEALRHKMFYLLKGVIISVGPVKYIRVGNVALVPEVLVQK